MKRSAPLTRKPPGLRFSEWIKRCTLERWKLHVRPLVLDDPDAELRAASVPLPEDRDVASELARRGFAPGRYEVRPVLTAKGEVADLERRQCGFNLHERAASSLRTVVPVTADMVAAPVPVRAVGSTVQVAREEAERAKSEVEKERQVLELEKLRDERAELEARRKRATASPPAPSPAEGIADVLRVVIEQTRASAETQRTLFEAMLKQGAERERLLLDAIAARVPEPAAPAPVVGGGLAGLVEQLRELRAVAPLLGLGKRAAVEEPQSEMAQLFGVLRDVLGAPGAAMPAPPRRPLPGAAAPPPPPPPPPAAPVLDFAANARTLARDRVAVFVRALATEAMQQTPPDAVAEQLYDDARLLPPAVSSALFSGAWSSAWLAAAQFVDPADHAAMGEMIRGAPGVEPWLVRFAASLQEIHEEEGEDDGDDEEPDARTG